MFLLNCILDGYYVVSIPVYLYLQIIINSIYSIFCCLNNIILKAADVFSI